MPFFTQRNAQIFTALSTTWLTLTASGQIPDNHITHWISVAMMGFSQVLIYLGFNRTPNGNILPDPVKQFVDSPIEGTLTKISPSLSLSTDDKLNS